VNIPTETIECPLCFGAGKLKRTEILDRLGVRDFARVAQLSAEEAFRLFSQKHKDDQQSVWLRFENELAKRIAEIREHHKDELHGLAVERSDLTRRVEDAFRELAQLRERNQELEMEMSKVARVGKREELDFADEARTWPGVFVSEHLTRNGDFLLAFRDLSGAPRDPHMLIDTKDKAVIVETDLCKLVRDAKERNTPIAILVARDESQLRQVDRECRWTQRDAVWVLTTTRLWFPRDLDVLRPLVERIGRDGLDFLNNNVALAEEVRRTFADLDRIDCELKKATKAVTSASALVSKYRNRLLELCDNAVGMKMPAGREPSAMRSAR
jgi:hypothetical protein